MVLSLPLLALLAFRPSWSYKPSFAWSILILLLSYGVLRNIPLWPLTFLRPTDPHYSPSYLFNQCSIRGSFLFLILRALALGVKFLCLSCRSDFSLHNQNARTLRAFRNRAELRMAKVCAESF